MNDAERIEELQTKLTKQDELLDECEILFNSREEMAYSGHASEWLDDVKTLITKLDNRDK